MKPVLQTLFGNKKGNCHQACLASILEMPLEVVPHFAVVCTAGDWWEGVRGWLHPMGLDLLHMDTCDESATYLSNAYYIMSGPSPRGNWIHAVVGFGGKMVHDPHPSGDGLKEHKWDEVFFVNDPAKVVEATPCY